MSGYIGNIPVPQATQTRDTFTATAGQTSFATSGYTPSFLDVFMNGSHLVNGTDYTATNGSDVVLTSGAADGDVLEVVAYSTYQVNSQNYTGGLTVDNDGATVLTVDRATSDGTIIDLQKDGSSVGSIGVRAGDLFLQGTDTTTAGIKMSDGAVRPCNSDGSNSDNDTDLGTSGTRFKDLYLSGGVYLGGTGSANYLDDYEEGTWTATITTNGTDFTTAGRGTSGWYTKVGNVVTAFFGVSIQSPTSGTGDLRVTGLPFTASGVASNAMISSSIQWGRVDLPGSFAPYGRVSDAQTYIDFLYSVNNANPTLMTAAELNGNITPYIVGSITYRTT